MNENRLRELAAKAEVQKREILDGRRGGYTPLAHSLYRTAWPRLREKLDVQSARDALFLLGYLHSKANGQPDHAYYMWAWPTIDQIRDETGIHRNRIKRLCDALDDAGLLVTEKVSHGNVVKNLYLPLFYAEDNTIETKETEEISAGITDEMATNKPMDDETRQIIEWL